MVKKLFKHELKAYLRVLLIVWTCMLGIATLVRFIQFFEQDSIVYDIVSVSSMIAYSMAIIACLVFPFIFAITRFYKNLFTGEGYLSFTLPVTPFQHIWVKLATSVLLQAVTVMVTLLSFVIVTAGDLLSEIWKAGDYLLNLLYTSLPEIKPHLPVYILELVLCLIVATATSLLLYYTCICVGQLSKKNRVLTAVGVYFGYYFICQVLETAGMSIISLFCDLDKLLEPVWEYAAAHPYAFTHLLLCGSLLLNAIMGAVYFFVSHIIIRKKLNLE